MVEQVKEVALKAWKSITKEEGKSLVMPMGRKIDCSYCKKGICYQILSVIYFHLLKYSV